MLTFKGEGVSGGSETVGIKPVGLETGQLSQERKDLNRIPYLQYKIGSLRTLQREIELRYQAIFDELKQRGEKWKAEVAAMYPEQARLEEERRDNHDPLSVFRNQNSNHQNRYIESIEREIRELEAELRSLRN